MQWVGVSAAGAGPDVLRLPQESAGKCPRVLEQGGHCDVDGLRGVLGMERKGEWGQ